MFSKYRIVRNVESTLYIPQRKVLGFWWNLFWVYNFRTLWGTRTEIRQHRFEAEQDAIDFVNDRKAGKVAKYVVVAEM